MDSSRSNLVSIIIPLHNGEDFIEQTLKACFNQSYKSIEVIVVENGSKDRSWEKLESINNPVLKKFSINAKSASEARNFGYMKSKGNFICFLDADDLIEEDKIELQINSLSSCKNDWISCGPWGKFKRFPEEAVFIKQKVWDVSDPIQWCLTSWLGGGMMVTGCWLIPRLIIEKSGYWNEDLSLHDDGEFMCRVLLNSKGIIFEKEAKLFYRQVDNSLSRQNVSFKAAKSALEVYQSYKTHILQLQDSFEVRKALAKNYAKFIYEFHPNYDELLSLAYKELDELKIKPPIVGGKAFQMLQRLFGFKRALKIKQLKR